MNYKWGIFTADLNPVIDSEQQGKRPVIVVSDETYNGVMPVLTILPITSLKSGRKVYPNEVLIKAKTGGLPRDSIILVHQIRTISKQRLSDPLGFIESHEIQASINSALKVHLNLD